MARKFQSSAHNCQPGNDWPFRHDYYYFDENPKAAAFKLTVGSRVFYCDDPHEDALLSLTRYVEEHDDVKGKPINVIPLRENNMPTSDTEDHMTYQYILLCHEDGYWEQQTWSFPNTISVEDVLDQARVVAMFRKFPIIMDLGPCLDTDDMDQAVLVPFLDVDG